MMPSVQYMPFPNAARSSSAESRDTLRRNALQRAGIKNFRWHDLRHVWATWHVMAGTTIAELQELGAWKSELMVKRYTHFAPEQLRSAATRLGTFLGTPGSAENAEARTTS